MKAEGSREQPLVSVVTPVYNGERYLVQCIESVLSQSYTNWEYVIVNNQSTDRTPEIIEDYAAKESRIRVHHNDEFLTILPNWNHALDKASYESGYIKVVHADDWLLPDCLSQMVALAERYPNVGVVGSYRHHGDYRIEPQHLKYPSTVLSGRDLCKLHVFEGIKLLGTPSSILMRADLVRSLRPLYNEQSLSADQEACIRLLADSDFGFVHQILTFTRLHPGTITASIEGLGSAEIGRFHAMMRYGPSLADGNEFVIRREKLLRDFYRNFARRVLRPGGLDVWRYRRMRFRALGYSLSYTRMLWSGGWFFLDRLLNPKRTIEGVVRAIRGRESRPEVTETLKRMTGEELSF